MIPMISCSFNRDSLNTLLKTDLLRWMPPCYCINNLYVPFSSCLGQCLTLKAIFNMNWGINMFFFFFCWNAKCLSLHALVLFYTQFGYLQWHLHLILINSGGDNCISSKSVSVYSVAGIALSLWHWQLIQGESQKQRYMSPLVANVSWPL